MSVTTDTTSYHISCVWLFVTPWTVSSQAPLSMGFSRQEYTQARWHLELTITPTLQWGPQSPLTSSLGFPLHLTLKYLPCSWRAFPHSSGLSPLFFSSWYPCLGLLPFLASTMLPSPVGLPNPGIKPTSLLSPALAGRFLTPVPPGRQLLHQLVQIWARALDNNSVRPWHPFPNAETWKERRF